MPLQSEDLYHVAWVVADLKSSMTSFGAEGLRWATPVTRTILMQTPITDPCEVSILVTYSIDDPMHVELIEHCANSPWQSNALGIPHHLGWWTSDLRADIELLIHAGHQLEAWMVGADGNPSRFAYLLNPQGMRVELVDIDVKPQLQAWWAGHAYP